MRFMITGANRGLGLTMHQYFKGDSFCRNNGYDITKDHQRLAELSLGYDVLVNNAFDGPFHEPWANFAQTNLLFSVADLWRKNDKSGLIINIGSVGTESVVSPEPDFETYRVSKIALKAHSLQWTRAFKENRVKFRTTLLTLDRLDTPMTQSRSNWTGNGIDTAEVCKYIDLIVNSRPNICIEEIVSWVNFDHKH